MTTLIGISGKAGVGKTTLARAICSGISYAAMSRGVKDIYEGPFDFTMKAVPRWDVYKGSIGNECEIRSFAYKLKQIVSIILECNIQDLNDESFKDTPLGDEWSKYKVIIPSGTESLPPDPWHMDPDVVTNRMKADEDYFGSLEEAAQSVDVNPSDIKWRWDSEDGIFEGRPDPDKFEDEDEKHFIIEKLDLIPRQLLQLLGTEFGRKMIHPNIWINSLFSAYTPDSNWIIDDVRFVDEAEAIRNRGGKLIRVDPSPEMQKEIDNRNEHDSETALDDYKFDYHIQQDYRDNYSKLIDKAMVSLFDHTVD